MDPQPPAPAWQVWLRRRLVPVLVAAWICSTLGWLSFVLPWWAELFSHFALHGFLSAVLLGIGLAVVRSWRGTTAAVILALIHLGFLAPAWIPTAATPTDGRDLHLMVANVLTSNPDRGPTIALGRDADLIALVEVDATWIADLTAGWPDHVLVAAEAREDNFGCALWVRRGIEATAKVETFAPFDLPAIFVQVAGIEISLIHPPPPISAEYAAARNDMLRSVADWSGSISDVPHLVIGDLNCTPWSPRLLHLLWAGGLHDTRRGRGNQASWPTALGPLGIPIDHILTSDPDLISERRLGSPTGSDHRPILARIRVPAR